MGVHVSIQVITEFTVCYGFDKILKWKKKKEKSFPGFLEYLKDYCLVDTSNRRKIFKK